MSIPRLDLLPDHVLDAERCLVGACAVWPEHLDREPMADLLPEHFADARWRACWRELRRLREEHGAIDPAILVAAVAASGDLTDAVVNAPDLRDAASHGLPEVHTRIIREAHTTRQVVLALTGALEQHRQGIAGEELLSTALERLAGVTVEQATDVLTAGDLVRARIADLAEIAKRKAEGIAAATGIPTGLVELDGLLGGLQRGIVTVAAGRPGMGKSAFAMALVDGASKAGVGCHVFSLEDTRDAYSDRLIARAARVSAQRLRACDLTRGELDNLDQRLDAIRERSGWIVDDRSGITAEEIVRSVRRQRARNSTEMVVVDYLQLVKAPRGIDKRDEQLAHQMQVFADAAKRDRIAYVVLSQLNRGCESRDNKRPEMSDLKGSGGIEEKAKAVVMLYRPVVYDESAPAYVVELLVRKNNNGATGTVEARFDAETICMY